MVVVDLGTVITEHQDLSGKQDKLVSGTNIKSINGQSILGSGNIVIEGGSSDSRIYYWDLSDGFLDEGELPSDFPNLDYQVIVLFPSGYMFLDRTISILYGIYGGILYEFDIDIANRTYILTTHDIQNSLIPLKDYLPLTGGTINGDLMVKNYFEVSSGQIRCGYGRMTYLQLDRYGFSYVDDNKSINFTFSGSGTKFLSDDGTYKEISGGTSSVGREIVVIDNLVSGIIEELEPNKITVLANEIESLDIWCFKTTDNIVDEYTIYFKTHQPEPDAPWMPFFVIPEVIWGNYFDGYLLKGTLYELSIVKTTIGGKDYFKAVIKDFIDET